MPSNWPKQFYNNRVKVTFPDGLIHFGKLMATLTINDDPDRLLYEVKLDKPWQGPSADRHCLISVSPDWVTNEQPE